MISNRRLTLTLFVAMTVCTGVWLVLVVLDPTPIRILGLVGSGVLALANGLKLFSPETAKRM